MIRGTTLNGSETCHNMKENEFRLLEAYEERLLVKTMQSCSKYPKAIIYLDLGIYPARF